MKTICSVCLIVVTDDGVDDGLTSHGYCDFHARVELHKLRCRELIAEAEPLNICPDCKCPKDSHHHRQRCLKETQDAERQWRHDLNEFNARNYR